jgi:hypothetical protein
MIGIEKPRDGLGSWEGPEEYHTLSNRLWTPVACEVDLILSKNFACLNDSYWNTNKERVICQGILVGSPIYNANQMGCQIN